MSQPKYIEKVAIVGVTGHVGKHFAEELLKTGKHTVTGLTRPDSKGTIPEGIKIARVDYADESAVVSALQGQQFLVITLGVAASSDLHEKIVKAAVKAGIPYIMPNTYGGDLENEQLLESSDYAKMSLAKCREVSNAGAAYINMTCGTWYEWSLALGEQWYGFDIKNRTATMFDDGKTIINTSTWAQCGRALAGLLSLPVEASSSSSPSVSQWANKSFYLSSFRISQRDMLDSLNRVLGTTDADWAIKHETTAQRIEDGRKEFSQGLRTGFAKMLYARNFTPGAGADFEARRELVNKTLNLPVEKLDDATREAVRMVESGWTPW